MTIDEMAKKLIKYFETNQKESLDNIKNLYSDIQKDKSVLDNKEDYKKQMLCNDAQIDAIEEDFLAKCRQLETLYKSIFPSD